MPVARRPHEAALARRFHESYERLAPEYGYKGALPWEDMPKRNKALTVAVVTEALGGVVDLLSDVATSGVEFDDPRIGYVTVQIDRETWEALAPYRPEGQSFVPMLKGP